MSDFLEKPAPHTWKILVDRIERICPQYMRVEERQEALTYPHHCSAEVRLAQFGAQLVHLNQQAVGEILLDETLQLNPGHGLLFTLRTRALLLAQVGHRVTPVTPLTAPAVISMSQLGSLGRFGNQLIQYMYLRVLARHHHCAYTTGDWLGSLLFGTQDPPTQVTLPPLTEDQYDPATLLKTGGDICPVGRDLQGYCLVHTSNLVGEKGFIQDLLQVAEPWRSPLQRQLDWLRDRGRCLVVIHLRRGDFGEGPFWVAPATSYEKWLTTLWEDLDHPLLYVATDAPDPFPELRYFEPVYARDLPPGVSGAEFMTDHWIMQHADYLAISNSSFSFTAAMLNRQASHILRPHPDDSGLLPFDPWNAEVVLSR